MSFSSTDDAPWPGPASTSGSDAPRPATPPRAVPVATRRELVLAALCIAAAGGGAILLSGSTSSTLGLAGWILMVVGIAASGIVEYRRCRRIARLRSGPPGGDAGAPPAASAGR